MTDIRDRNAVTVEGEGPRTVVLAHGFGCDQRMWDPIASSFSKTDRVVRFDYVGSGRSDATSFDPLRYGTLQGYADDVCEVLDALGLRGVDFVGHSVSAMIGARIAVQRPELFSSIAMIAPSPRYLNDPPDYVGGFEARDVDQLLAMMDQNFIGWASNFSQFAAQNDRVAGALRESFCANDPRTIGVFARATFACDERETLPKVSMPCLVLQCRNDDIAPVAVGRYVASRLPKARYVLLDVAGHLPHLTHPHLVEAALRAFFAALTEGAL